MGKHKHSQDKLHKTVGELKSHHVGTNRDLELSQLHRRLRFDSCCLSLNTITGEPVGLCDDDGFCYVFDSDMIVKYLEKYQTHPITGSKISSIKQLIKLKFHKNNEDQYYCPVNLKVFNHLSKIVANAKTGNVYSYEAYQSLNLKAKNWRDLLNDEPFDKDTDIVIIQDPDTANEKWKVSDFHYVKKKLKIDDEEAGGSKIRNIEPSSILKASLDEYRKQADDIVKTFNKIVGQETGKDEQVVTGLNTINSAGYSDGSLSRSVTSTVEPVISSQTPAQLNKEQIIYPKIKKKGYLQLMTNLGPINLELFCDRCPKTCHNFMLLASRGYYDNTCFHRLIKNFMIQGGDPTGTGRGGQSAWGGTFKDECLGDIKHEGRGMIAMANSGPATNKSQFYITLKGSWPHLDGKHTVFGRVVGGDETLDKIEAVEADKKDRPKKEIRILKVTKYVDPFEEVELELEKKAKEEEDEQESKRHSNNDNKRAKSVGHQKQLPLKKFRSGVGTYLNLDGIKRPKKMDVENDTDVSATTGVRDPESTSEEGSSLSNKLAHLSSNRKQVEAKKTYGNFSGW